MSHSLEHNQDIFKNEGDVWVNRGNLSWNQNTGFMMWVNQVKKEEKQGKTKPPPLTSPTPQ